MNEGWAFCLPFFVSSVWNFGNFGQLGQHSKDATMQKCYLLPISSQMKIILLVRKVFCICTRAGFVYAMGHLHFNISLGKF